MTFIIEEIEEIINSVKNWNKDCLFKKELIQKLKQKKETG